MTCHHDWAVYQMTAGLGLKAYYNVQCLDCGAIRAGYSDEIPDARFASAEELGLEQT